ncbi:MAG: LysR family transcriptional regulator [Rhizobiaceae bacterium]|nr:LysR family transcriptional regulator [Rhizobiaceae bacterium]
MNLRAFDLNLLRVLDALMRDQSTTLAGQRIGLSQPAVSAALGRLRAALNDPLFVRHGQRLEPTVYARSLEAPLRRILDDLELLLSGPATFDPSQAEETFKISGSDFFSTMLMPDLGERLAREAPGIRIQMVDLVPDNYVATLESYDVDLALLPSLDHPEWTAFQPLFNSSFAVIARRDHARLKRAGVKPGEAIPIDLFCDLGHVLFSPEGNLKAMGDAALAKVGRERRVVMTMPTFGGVCGAVARSEHIALIPQQLAHEVAAGIALAVYKPPMPMPLPLIGMLWHKRATQSPPHKWLRGVIAELMYPLNADEPPLPGGARAQ